MSTHNLWLVGRLDLPLGELVPVNALEEDVSLDVALASIRVAAQPPGGVLGQELQERQQQQLLLSHPRLNSMSIVVM